MVELGFLLHQRELTYGLQIGRGSYVDFLQPRMINMENNTDIKKMETFYAIDVSTKIGGPEQE
jgi:hypothetical protein